MKGYHNQLQSAGPALLLFTYSSESAGHGSWYHYKNRWDFAAARDEWSCFLQSCTGSNSFNVQTNPLLLFTIISQIRTENPYKFRNTKISILFSINSIASNSWSFLSWKLVWKRKTAQLPRDSFSCNLSITDAKRNCWFHFRCPIIYYLL